MTKITRETVEQALKDLNSERYRQIEVMFYSKEALEEFDKAIKDELDKMGFKFKPSTEQELTLEQKVNNMINNRLNNPLI